VLKAFVGVDEMYTNIKNKGADMYVPSM